MNDKIPTSSAQLLVKPQFRKREVASRLLNQIVSEMGVEGVKLSSIGLQFSKELKFEDWKKVFDLLAELTWAPMLLKLSTSKIKSWDAATVREHHKRLTALMKRLKVKS